MTSKTYVVTGAANGIGRSLVEILQIEGHQVIGLDLIRPDAPMGQHIDVDLNDPQSIHHAALEIPDAIDGLCNCAGLPPRSGLEAKILGVNYLGTKNFTNLIQPKLNKGGSVVNMASRAGHKWRDNLDQVKRFGQISWTDLHSFIEDESIDPVRAYDLSKEAVILWTMAASESYLNKDQRINSISPGAVQTAIMQDFSNAFGERMTKNVERAGRAGTAEEIAHLAAFLLSPKSGWIKGTDISIDGGMSAFGGSDALELDGLAS